MKKCPTCDKTYEDSMRFCQVDGTPLEDDAPAFDPYATIVARSPAAPAEPESKPAPPPEPAEPTASEASIAEPSDVLDLPGNDPLKTMYVSEDEMKAALGGSSGESEVIDIAPAASDDKSAASSEPDPPKFNAPEVPAPNFNDMTPPPSPFSSSGNDAERPVPPPSFSEPEPPRTFNEAETMISAPLPKTAEPEKGPDSPGSFGSAGSASANPFDAPTPAPAAQWTPPPAPEANWQNQEIGSNTPFQPPPAGVAGQNKTLAIVSLVCGILSLLCCSWFVVGAAALITGFMARGKAKSNPAEYGGTGLALAGMITGGISVLLGIVFWILYVLGFMAGIMNNAIR